MTSAEHLELVKQAQAKSITYAKNESAAQELRTAMSSISERYYCAGWLLCLEYTLWGMAQGTVSREWGLGTVGEAEIAEIKQLSEAAGGWWAWSDIVDAELFLPLAEWYNVYQAYVDEDI